MVLGAHRGLRPVESPLVTRLCVHPPRTRSRSGWRYLCSPVQVRGLLFFHRYFSLPPYCPCQTYAGHVWPSIKSTNPDDEMEIKNKSPKIVIPFLTSHKMALLSTDPESKNFPSQDQLMSYTSSK